MFKNMYIYRGIVAQFTKKHKSNSPVLCVIAGFRSSVLFSCTSPFDKAHFSRRCNYSALVYIPTHCSRYVICVIVPFVTACARYRLLFDIGVQIKPASGTISSKLLPFVCSGFSFISTEHTGLFLSPYICTYINKYRRIYTCRIHL